jgi:hypothetical protein
MIILADQKDVQLIQARPTGSSMANSCEWYTWVFMIFSLEIRLYIMVPRAVIERTAILA